MKYELNNYNIFDIERIKLKSLRYSLYYNKSKHYEVVVKQLLDKYGKKYENDIRCLVTNIAKAFKSRTEYLTVTLHTEHYSNNILGISYRKTKKLLDMLECDGYIDIYKGFSKGKTVAQDFKVELSSATVIKFNKPLANMWEDRYHKYVNLIDFDLIEVRDRETKKNKSTRGFKGLADKRSFMKKYNMLLESVEFSAIGEFIPSPLYKRVYTDSPSKGGRFYNAGNFQTMKKELRPSIKIDGEDTICLDYSALHPCLCYNLVDVEMEEWYSPYDCDTSFLHVDEAKLEEFKVKYNKPDYNPMRNLVKIAMLCILNSPEGKGDNSASIAMLAISSKIGEDKVKQDNVDTVENSLFYGLCFGKKPIPVKELVKSILTHNFPIAEFFFTDIGLELQRVDSDMAEYILGHFLQKNEVALSYHDGFLVRKTLRDELYSVMKDAYKEVTGTSKNCKVKQEY